MFLVECLELLISSLDQAPFDIENIAMLFYLAETVLYTVRTDTSQQPCLTMPEIQLLTVGRLAFSRLYFHHMAGQLVDFDDLKSHLCIYLDGVCWKHSKE